VIAGRGIHELSGDANAIAGLADTALQHVTDTEFAPDLLDIDSSALEREAGVPSDNEKLVVSGRAVMISSTIPSAKYSCSGSPLMFSKGSTAMEGLSGSGSTRGWLTAEPEFTAEGV
jgi:hypothetical protein